MLCVVYKLLKLGLKPSDGSDVPNRNVFNVLDAKENNTGNGCCYGEV